MERGTPGWHPGVPHRRNNRQVITFPNFFDYLTHNGTLQNQ